MAMAICEFHEDHGDACTECGTCAECLVDMASDVLGLGAEIARLRKIEAAARGAMEYSWQPERLDQINRDLLGLADQELYDALTGFCPDGLGTSHGLAFSQAKTMLEAIEQDLAECDAPLHPPGKNVCQQTMSQCHARGLYPVYSSCDFCEHNPLAIKG